MEAIQGPLREPFKDVYNAPPVEAYVGEARSWLEASDERFDLIMLMSVGGYPQLMLEPGNMIRTIEAFQVFDEDGTGTILGSYGKLPHDVLRWKPNPAPVFINILGPNKGFRLRGFAF